MAKLIVTNIVGDLLLTLGDTRKIPYSDHEYTINDAWGKAVHDYSEVACHYLYNGDDNSSARKLLLASGHVEKGFIIKSKAFYDFVSYAQQILKDDEVLYLTEFGMHLDTYIEFRFKVAISKNDVRVVESTEPIDLNYETAEDHEYPSEEIKKQLGVVFCPSGAEEFGFQCDWKYDVFSTNRFSLDSLETGGVFSIIYAKPIHLKLTEELKHFVTEVKWGFASLDVYRLEEDYYLFAFDVWFYGNSEFHKSNNFKRLEQLINECALNGEKFEFVEYGTIFDSTTKKASQIQQLYSNVNQSKKLSVF